MFKKQRMGVTVNGHVEKCTIPENQECSRHKIHRSSTMRNIFKSYRFIKYTLMTLAALSPLVTLNPVTLLLFLGSITAIGADITGNILSSQKTTKYAAQLQTINNDFNSKKISKEEALLKLEALTQADITRGKLVRRAKIVSIAGSSLVGFASMPLITASNGIAIAIYTVGVVASNTASAIFYSVYSRATDKFIDVKNSTSQIEQLNTEASKQVHQKIVKRIQQLTKTSNHVANNLATGAEKLAFSILNDDFNGDNEALNAEDLYASLTDNKTKNIGFNVLENAVDTYEDIYLPDKKPRKSNKLK